MDPVFPRLEMVAGPDEGLLIPLNEGDQVLGRAGGVEIFLSDTSISRRHTTFKRSGNTLTLRDLGSRNGTLINGKQVSPGTEYPVAHLDQIQVGIYEFRVALRASTPEEIKSKVPPEIILKKTNENVASEDPSQITHNDKLDDSPSTEDTLPDVEDSAGALPSDEPSDVSDQADEPQEKDLIVPDPEQALIEVPELLNQEVKVPFYRSPYIWVPSLVLVILIITALIVRQPLYDFLVRVGVVAVSDTASSVEVSKESTPTQKPVDNNLNTAEAAFKTVFQEIEPLKVDQATQALQRDIFLDLKSEPIPARIFWREQTLGITPLKTPLSLKPNEEAEIVAEFDLRDIHDRYQMKYNFKISESDDVVSHVFSAPIGVIKILKLPRDVDFYMEGFYAYDKYKSNPMILTDITYGKPIHVPYGHYIVELREKVRVVDSETFVTEIRYHREFDLDDKRPHVELSILDKDLKMFPAKIQSAPSGASIFLDDKEIGKTPFEGDMPLGAHELKLTREGYFDYRKPIDMRTNTPYESLVKLETSKVGQYINRAKELRRLGQAQQAIGQLVEGLKLGASSREKNEIQWFLGELYLDQKEYSQARTYFNLAREGTDYKYRAVIGLAKVAFAIENTSESLKLLVEVLVNVSDDDPVVKEARTLFSQLSPFKSVVYISSDPPGASVYVNNQLASQTTPLILSDLALGTYRLEFQKNGFKTQQVKKSLKINEFVPVMIKLEPDQL